jgi:hypothetical protein
VARSPLGHRRENALTRPAALDRARVAPLAIGVRVSLAVARLGVGTAAPAHPDVARLDRPRLLAGWVIEVGLDRRRRATEAVGDLSDRESLGFAVMPGQCDRPATLEHTVIRARRRAGRHTFQVRLRSRYVSNSLRLARRAVACSAQGRSSDRVSRSTAGRSKRVSPTPSGRACCYQGKRAVSRYRCWSRHELPNRGPSGSGGRFG